MNGNLRSKKEHRQKLAEKINKSAQVKKEHKSANYFTVDLKIACGLSERNSLPHILNTESR